MITCRVRIDFPFIAQPVAHPTGVPGNSFVSQLVTPWLLVLAEFVTKLHKVTSAQQLPIAKGPTAFA